MRVSFRWITAILVLTALTACAGRPATQAPTAAPTVPAITTTIAPTLTPTTAPVAEAPTTKITEGCITAYDPAADYFPQKAVLSAASGLTIDYFKNYKVITVLNPWRDATEQFKYILVQCGTPTPPNVGNAQVIEVPIKTIVTMSTTQLPHLAELGLLDSLVGHDSFKYVNTPAVVERIKAGKLREIGSGAQVNVEQLLDLKPDLVMTYGVGNPENDAHPKLLEASLKVAINAEYMEDSPLSRAEWIKFTAAFFNREADATAIYERIATRYNAMAAKAQGVTNKPTIFVGAPFQGTWYMPGGNSYVARLLADAGAAYLWADDDSTGSQQLSFEVVFEKAQNADFWLNTSSWQRLTDGANADERFTRFAAFQNGKVFNNNARLNENGGNDYWETGVTNPDLVLADLIKIFHPELLPNHKLFFYQQLQP